MQYQVPTENINICVVGGVSTGKSTILNAIFCEQYTQCKIKRTTMIPSVYVENPPSNNSIIQSPEEILEIVSQKNKELIDKTEQNMETTQDEYNELVFQVGKLDINIIEDAFVNVYDIPGLNDARTKQIYYNYLEKKFNEFNIIIFIVDLHSGMNTNDEIDILNFITTHTNYHNKNGKKIYSLVIVNKADDLQIDETSGDLIITGELKEMYEQVEKTVVGQYERLEIRDQLIGIIPLCALDSYLYRMVQKHGKSFKLTQEQILKIGINEHGKKFSTWKPAVQEQKVYECLEDREFIQTMIQLSGFSSLEKYLKKFLETQSKPIRVNNILQEINKLDDFSKIFKIKTLDTTVLNVLVKTRDLYAKIKEINGEFYQIKVMEFAENISIELEKQIHSFSSITCLIDAYDLFVETIFDSKFDDLYNILNLNKYLPSLKEKTMNLLIREINTSGYSLFKFYKGIEKLNHIDAFTKKNVETLMETMCTNIFYKDINMSIDVEDDVLINMIEHIRETLCVDVYEFIKWILFNKYSADFYKKDELLYLVKLYYQKNNDYQMLNLVNAIIMDSSNPYTITMKTYMKDVNALFQKYDGMFELEKYYTKLINHVDMVCKEKHDAVVQNVRFEIEEKIPIVSKNVCVNDNVNTMTDEYELKYLKLKLDYQLLSAKMEHLAKQIQNIEQTQNTIMLNNDGLNEKINYLENQDDCKNTLTICNYQNKIDEYIGCGFLKIKDNCKIQIKGREHKLTLIIINEGEQPVTVYLNENSLNYIKPITSSVSIEILFISEFLYSCGTYAEFVFTQLFTSLFSNILDVKLHINEIDRLTELFNKTNNDYRIIHGKELSDYTGYNRTKIVRSSTIGLTSTNIINYINSVSVYTSSNA